MKASKTTLTLALTAAIGAAGIANAAGNPFALNALSQGYMVAAADKAPRTANVAKANAAPRKTPKPRTANAARASAVARSK